MLIQMKWVLLLVAIGIGAFFLLRPATKQEVMLPSLSLENSQSQKVDIASYKGKPVVLNAWATWCGPCRRELPTLIAQSKQRTDITFLYVNQGEGPEAIRIFEEEVNYKIPLVLLDKQFQLSEIIPFQGLPTTFIFNREGKLVTTHIGEINKEELEAYLKDL